jgi:NADH:ubiquinone oxidoreductase subunit 4 (subunit M)
MLILIVVLGFVPSLIFDVTNSAASAIGETFQALGN